MDTSQVTEELVEVRCSAEQVFIHLPKQFCRYCGVKGIYEEQERINDAVFCFHCEAALPYELHNPDHTLLACKRMEEKVVDRREWTELVKPESALNKAIRESYEAVARNLNQIWYHTLDGQCVNYPATPVARYREKVLIGPEGLLTPEQDMKLLELPEGSK